MTSLSTLLEGAGIEEQLHALARHELAGLVLPAQALLAAAEFGAPLEVAQRRQSDRRRSFALDAGVAERAHALHLDHHAVAGHERARRPTGCRS